MTQRALAQAATTSQAAIARYEAGQVLPELRTLDRLLSACGHHLTLDARPARRTGTESATHRPVAIPDDLADPDLPKAHGTVALPIHLRWSGPPRTYDLDDRRDRARLYEQVLREGDEDDIRHYVRLEDLLDLWDELVLPDSLRTAWERWLAARQPSA